MALLTKFEEEKGVDLSNSKTKIIYGCWIVQKTLQSELRREFIERGFKDCGHDSANFETMMARCYKELTAEEHQNMKLHEDEDCKFFKIHGQLTEEKMDISGIPTIDQGTVSTPRDQRVLQNQRATLLTHPSTIARQQTTIGSSSVGLGAAIMQIADAKERKVVRQYAKMVAKDEKSKQQKKLKLEQKAAMTSDEIAAQKETKKKAREEKKAQKGVELSCSCK